VAAHDAASRFSAAGGTLYVVATPLGNLRDVTLRALDVLGSADVIAAEDTRVTTVLLRHYGIATRPLSMHEHNEARRVAHIERLLRAGKSVALVSDAGTPAVSDPGARLVAAIRSAGLNVVPIPGANAAVAAISAAGLDAERFVFMGFLPPAAKARRALLASVAKLPLAIVIYEAPHRAARTIAELTQALGGGRTIFIAREITKKFETLARLPLDGAGAWLDADPNRRRGEFVLVVDRPADTVSEDDGTLPFDVDRLLAALAQELPPTRAARVAADATGLARDVLYAKIRALRPATD
jgi:16S rRNA (cytidine1402-2'-O)-methyltransferase